MASRPCDGAKTPPKAKKTAARRANRAATEFVERLSRLFLFVLLLQMAITPLARAEAPFSFAATPGKLPKTVIPKNYSVHLQPDFENLTTHGTVLIDLQALQPTCKIVLNALDLEVTYAAFAIRSSPSPPPPPPPLGEKAGMWGWTTVTAITDTNQQTVTLTLPSQLPRGKHRLYLEFNGHLREQEQGLFYVKYNSPSGKKIMLATQMEANDARRMFPCWDEPVFRASVDLAVVLPSKLKAVSNMPIKSEKILPGDLLPGGLKETRFARTPPMASYLVVLVCGELEELRDEAEGVQIRVITTEGKKEQGRYALDATKKLLAYYNRYFGIKYPLPKLDQIAVPGGFDGAMENWGGITYNESVLLFDPQTSSQQTMRDIFVTVAHEMSHQWFGDLVTMAWWNDLWLNEGFATWMETKATDHFNPDWQMWLSADADKAGVMSSDARSTTHAIQQEVNSESEANDAFDEITYQKGGAFLRMFEDYLGPEDFRRGIHRYLSRHRYSNATTADLWAALETASSKPVKAIAPGWIEQPGLPVVTVKSACTNGTQTLLLQQERFTVQDPHAESLLWKIPLALLKMASHQPVTHYLLSNQTGSVTFPDCAPPVKANAGNVGYYRVAYAPALFHDILQHIAELPDADRLNLLSDSWAMVEGKRSSITNYFFLADSLRNDPTYAIWNQILTALYLIDDLEENQPARAAFQEYVRRLLQPQFQRLGWKPHSGEAVTDALLRGKIIGALGHFGDQSVIAEAKTRFESFVSRPETLAPDLRPAVLTVVGRYADQENLG